MCYNLTVNGYFVEILVYFFRFVNRALKGGESLRTDYIPRHVLELLLTALMPQNRLVIRASLVSGLRISDVLGLQTAKLKQRMTVRESKTGKTRRIYWPAKIYEQMFEHAGKYFVFEGRLDPKRHRTRAAVFKDLKRVARLYRIDGRKIAENVAPHSARKIFAVEALRDSKDLKKVQHLLNHDSEAVTMLYAMADVITRDKLKQRAL